MTKLEALKQLLSQTPPCPGPVYTFPTADRTVLDIRNGARR